jgi:DNA helicase-2/ATP-dependent DNA helicase PcrA
MSNENFLSEYKKLNNQQKQAVDAIDGPVMVIAGPGTGKTTVLGLRIVNILRKTDTPPDAILALTFTDSGVTAIREKLFSLLGSRAYTVRVHTFHSFANDLIKNYPDYYPRIIGGNPLDDLDSIRLVTELINRLPLKMLRPNNHPTYYVKPVIKAIKELKRENVSPKKFKEFVTRLSTHSKNKQPKRGSGDYLAWRRDRELSLIYQAYEKELLKRRLYDYEDMIMETIKMFEKQPDFLLSIRENCHFILADEHQDANMGQNRLLELLAGSTERPNLFIVGDEKQAIFRFQGASLENFSYFQKRYPLARIIALTISYRSHQTILDAAHSLIKKSEVDSRTNHLLLQSTVNYPRKKLVLVETPNQTSERLFLAAEIKKILKRGVKPEAIAILVRENKDIEPLEKTLRTFSLPTQKHSNADALAHPRINAFINFLETILNPINERLAVILFYDFLKISPHEAWQVINQARENKKLIISEMRRAGGELAQLARKFADFLLLAKNQPPPDAFQKIAKESGFLARLLALPDNSELLNSFEAVEKAAEKFVEKNKRATLADFIEYLKEMWDHHLGIPTGGVTLQGIQIMTAHRAKGLEFDFVFITQVNDGVWGGRQNRQLFFLPGPSAPADIQNQDDERRLFFVALTRARKEVFITRYRFSDDGRELLPSRFITEIREDVFKKKEITRQSPALLIKRKKTSVNTLLQRKFIRSLFLQRGLAVTHLNNFLKCPWKYFFVNLLRLPQPKTSAAIYGSAIHAALKYYFNAYRQERWVSFKALNNFFLAQLNRTRLTEREVRHYSSMGILELKKFLKSECFPKIIWNEVKIKGVLFPIGGGKTISLNGSLDKIELLPDGFVNVVDYKTGPIKSRNEILGKTKKASGDYFRQLVFYRLLLADHPRWRMRTGTIAFIRPDKQNRFRRETFEIKEIDLIALKEKIRQMAKAVLNLSFLGHTCGQTNCEWCNLARMIE